MTKLQIGERVWCRIDGVERRCRIARVRICATPNVDWPNLYLVQVESSGLRVWVSPENVSVLIDEGFLRLTSDGRYRMMSRS